jgi:lipoate-protein ligase A
VLFLYTDRPSIVIGRNQNPWVEVNLGLLKNKLGKYEKIDLVRRRSGGGTVFHDEGNVNYSVICPTSVFDRDTHAHMVVRALQSLGVTRAKVNERHDIVLDVRPKEEKGEDIDEQALPEAARRPLKISGSAYKLTRLRSLHHGTCLLNSPNIGSIGQYLRAPAKPYILARGVDSVPSPITNVNLANDQFESAVVNEFTKLYGAVEPVFVDESDAEVPEIAKGLAELRSLEWTYLQTPQFTFSTHETEQDDRERPALPATVPADTRMEFTAKHGAVTEAQLTLDGEDPSAETQQDLVGKQIHTIKDWQTVVRSAPLAQWLNTIFKQ